VTVAGKKMTKITSRTLESTRSGPEMPTCRPVPIGHRAIWANPGPRNFKVFKAAGRVRFNWDRILPVLWRHPGMFRP